MLHIVATKEREEIQQSYMVKTMMLDIIHKPFYHVLLYLP